LNPQVDVAVKQTSSFPAVAILSEATSCGVQETFHVGPGQIKGFNITLYSTIDTYVHQ